MAESKDILILGSGFGGSLLAAILAKHGMRVVLVDRGRHPRFAIGESSTPLADATLRRLATRYDLSQLLPLTRYGSWKQHTPQLMCGNKRGFTYFQQRPATDITPEEFDGRRLLVAASRDDDRSDTHWLRSDVDDYFFRQAQDSGVHCLQSCDYELGQQHDLWKISGTSEDRTFACTAPFIVDATGSSGALLKYLRIPDQTETLKTNSRAVFAHFTGVHSNQSMLQSRGIDVSGFPYTCDAAAVHHVLHGGWMWQLRFDDQTVSAGFVTDHRPAATISSQVLPTAQQQWDRLLAQYPYLAEQFADASIIRPSGGLQRSGRLQRLTTQAAGDNWAALPNTAGFIDPLHSTGIAHTLTAVERLADILLDTLGNQTATALQQYSRRIISEIQIIDELVEGCYAALPDFGLWCDWTMLYFAAVTSDEQSTGSFRDVASATFLHTDDKPFRGMLRTARQQLDACLNGQLSRTEFTVWLRAAVMPWNQVGLLDDAVGGLYRDTAAGEQL